MNFELVRGSLELPADDKAVAKVILNFFLYQYQRALEAKINNQQELKAFRAANVAAREEYNKDDEMSGLGWDRRFPYTEAQIKNKEEEVKQAERQYAEMARVLEFVKDRFVEKFI
jgi:cation transport regulator ChaB